MIRTAFIADVIGDAITEERNGIQPKVQIALKLLVAHLDAAEREIDRQRQRIDALERFAHPPTPTDARATTRLSGR